ncbi:MAG: GNAT family N-acetyltransferase [Candidatus Planktophila sp.]
MELAALSVEEISSLHVCDEFSCGNNLLDRWLEKYALLANKTQSAKVYVLTNKSKKVFGYYALSMGSVDYKKGTSRVQKGLGRHPIPVVLISRLAVDGSLQGRGIGAHLLREAVLKSLLAAEKVGAVAIVVHPIDGLARRFYGRYGFEQSPIDADVMMVRIKDIKQELKI